MNKLTNKLENIGACNEAVEWIQSFSSYEEAWNKCERGDWMLWIAQRAGTDLRTLTKAKVECAKLAEHLMIDERSINALRTAERFADGMATRVELEEAAQAAHDAADAAYAAAAYSAHAAYAAAAYAAAAYSAHAAHAAYAAASADDASADDASADDAYAAASADDAAASAASANTITYAYVDSAYKETLNKCANICRQYLDFNEIEPFLDSIN